MSEPNEDRVQRRGWRVIGRVQGVGFRWWTRRTASGLGLGGWVRNEPDGSVVVHAAGSGDGLERLAEALRQGPTGARVDGVEEVPADRVSTVDGFRIRM